jgi:bifunctional non-homologous end joining protein LigD
MNLGTPARVAEAARSIPVHYVVFDILYDGREVTSEPLEDRLGFLDATELPAHFVRSERVPTEGDKLFEAVRRERLEGIVGKRLGSVYRPGARSPDWRKVAAVRRTRAVVGGFTPGEGGRSDSFGSLLLGLYDADGLRWIGSVGTGFDTETLRAIRKALDQMTIDACPFEPDADLPGQAVWVEPVLVAEIEFKEWTRAGRLRAPAFKGLSVVPPEEATWITEGPGDR